VADPLNVREFLAGYLAEAEEHLSSASRNLVAIDESHRVQEQNPKAVRELFRSLHTLKGLSAMVGAESIVDIAHELETLLRAADRGGGALPESAVDPIATGIRAIQERVLAMARGEVPAPAPRTLIDALSSLQISGEGVSQTSGLLLDLALLDKLAPAEKAQLVQGLDKGRKAFQVEFHPSQARSAEGMNITRVREDLSRLGDLVKVLPRANKTESGKPGSVSFLLLVVTDASAEEVARAAGAEPSGVQSIQRTEPSPALPREAYDDDPLEPRRNVVRVDVARLDEALEQLSELVISRARMQRAVADLTAGRGNLRELTAVMSENGRQLKKLRAAIMRARMVPVSELLDRAPLLVRGLASSSGKRVRLQLDVGDSELDKSVADRLFPVIVHLLRNAVDHALELPEERRARGKPEEGNVTVRASRHSDNHLELTVEDDGRGIDRVKVAQRMKAPAAATDEELLKLICQPGFSTLDKATHTSGRGFGMDIVHRVVVQELRGELSLATMQGQGTRFVMKVPLTVSILDVFSFECGGQTFVVPVAAVEDLLELDSSQSFSTPSAQEGAGRVRVLHHRGTSLPLLRLCHVLGLKEKGHTAQPKAIVVRKKQDVVAFEVDRMLGQQEAVVRPLEDPLVAVRGVTGSTDLGTGKPTLVLDLWALMEKAGATA